MKLANCFGLVIALVLNVACNSTTSATAEESSPRLVTAAEFAAMPSSFDGREVTVRGYLGVQSRDLIIYPSKAAADQFNFYENAVFVYDTSPDRKLGLEGVDGPINCTNHYVELTGIGGILEARGINGIIDIKTIETFESDDFEGSGRRCYP
ncbi:MAG: hypothetical protein ACE5EM_04220 [Sphingomonadales bacterium]